MSVIRQTPLSNYFVISGGLKTSEAAAWRLWLTADNMDIFLFSQQVSTWGLSKGLIRERVSQPANIRAHDTDRLDRHRQC
jgi:hypothetical protein